MNCILMVNYSTFYKIKIFVFHSQVFHMLNRTVVLIAAFSQYTKNMKIPCLSLQRKKGCVRKRLPIFRLFPVSTNNLMSKLEKKEKKSD